MPDVGPRCRLRRRFDLEAKQVPLSSRRLDAFLIQRAEADIRGMALWNMSTADFADAYAGLDALLHAGTIRSPCSSAVRRNASA